MTNKLDVGKALEKLRGSDEPKSRMTILDEKNKALDEEIRRLRAERLRLERGEPEPPKERLRNHHKQTSDDRSGMSVLTKDWPSETNTSPVG